MTPRPLFARSIRVAVVVLLVTATLMVQGCDPKWLQIIALVCSIVTGCIGIYSALSGMGAFGSAATATGSLASGAAAAAGGSGGGPASNPVQAPASSSTAPAVDYTLPWPTTPTATWELTPAGNVVTKTVDPFGNTRYDY